MMTEQPETTQTVAPPPAPGPTRRFQCRHIHVTGLRCGSPCLRGENFCYYHHSTRRPPQPLAQGPSPQEPPTQDPLTAVFTLSSLEDHTSIQLALTEVLTRLAANSLDPARARLLLRGLHIASDNLHRQSRTVPVPHSSRSDEWETRKPSAIPIRLNPTVEDFILDPHLGPIAPIAEVGAPDAAEASLTQRFRDFCNRPTPVCPRCAEHDRLDDARTQTLPVPHSSRSDEWEARKPVTLPSLNASTDEPHPTPAFCVPHPTVVASKVDCFEHATARLRTLPPFHLKRQEHAHNGCKGWDQRLRPHRTQRLSHRPRQP